MLARKDEVVKGLTDGVRFLFRKNRVETIFGTGRVSSPTSVQVALNEGGSLDARDRPHLAGDRVGAGRACRSCRSTARRSSIRPERSAFDKVPDHLVVVGAGYIGLELGSVWKRLGAKVTVIEFLPRIVPDGRPGDGRPAQEEPDQAGPRIPPGDQGDRGVDRGRPRDGPRRDEGWQDSSSFECDRVLVAVGRRPFTQGLGLAEAGVTVDPKTGKVPVDAHFRTNVADDLGDRRPDRRPDAGPQGRGRGDRLSPRSWRASRATSITTRSRA